MAGLPWIDAETVEALVPPTVAVEALRSALEQGLDPSRDTPRTAVPLEGGQFLLMPAQVPGGVGVKVLTVAPGNPDRNLPRIQGLYLLCDPETLSPLALLDGIAMTNVRTPAVSALAVSVLAVPDATRLVVFGSGPQAEGHVRALRAVRGLTHVDVVSRRPERAERLAAAVSADGLSSEVAGPDAVAEADIVVCATTAREPLFPASLVRDGTCVVAVGSHEPDARELDGELLGRSTVVVEDVATAEREAGDVVLAATEGHLSPSTLLTLADLVRGAEVDRSRPTVFKSTGMSWEDLVVAAEAWRRHEEAVTG